MNIYDKKYQIFISSTYLDLKDAREEITKVILGLYQIPIGMEMFSADNEEQWSIIKSTIDNSDYYLLIVGHRYGSLAKDGISYTEKEFDYAKDNGIPIIAFVRKRDVPTKPEQRDDDYSKSGKLDSFLEKVLNNAMCDFWENENELGQKVAISLTKMFFKTPRIGWVRSDNSTPIETASELTTLIQENRELREKIEKIESLANKEQPDIDIFINEDSRIELEYNESLLTSIKTLDFANFPDELKRYTTVEKVEIYNQAIIEQKEEIDIYCEKLNEYKCKKENNFQIKIKISNKGSIKANDLYVDLAFPKEVKIFEKEDLNDIEKPKRPEIPANPYEVASRKFNESILKKTAGLYTNQGMISSISFPSSVISSKILRNINVNRNFWIDNDKNSMTIKLSKLTHTRSIIIDDDILIAPVEKGEFNVSISIVCDELKEPLTKIIPLIVK